MPPPALMYHSSHMRLHFLLAARLFPYGFGSKLPPPPPTHTHADVPPSRLPSPLPVSICCPRIPLLISWVPIIITFQSPLPRCPCPPPYLNRLSLKSGSPPTLRPLPPLDRSSTRTVEDSLSATYLDVCVGGGHVCVGGGVCACCVCVCKWGRVCACVVCVVCVGCVCVCVCGGGGGSRGHTWGRRRSGEAT